MNLIYTVIVYIILHQVHCDYCKWFCITTCNFPSLTWIARGRVFDAMMTLKQLPNHVQDSPKIQNAPSSIGPDMSRWTSRVNGQFILPSKQNNAGYDVSVTAVLHRYISTPVAVWLCLKIGCLKVQIMVSYVHIFSLLKPISWTSISFSKPPANSWNHVFSTPMCRFILWKVMQ